MTREPRDLSPEELLAIVEELHEQLFREGTGLNPDKPVSGADLVDWAVDAMKRHHLIPD